MLLIFICIGLLMVTTSLGYFDYQERIPNGNNVNHPCKPNYRWLGVGHQNPLGGGERNVFGKDFQKAGYKWTKTLCDADSDGDGRTNGDELGDRDCSWTVGSLPARIINITHPGICEPYGSELCKGKDAFVSCELESFEGCAALNETDVRILDIKFNQTKVPAVETSYYCMTFDLPSDQDYHIIANEPIIDNVNILHHMLMFGCENPDDAYIPYPQACGMSTQGKCGSILTGWTVGDPGKCFGDNVGFRIGNSSYKRVRLEIHYNNPFLVDNYVDSSGLRIYYQQAKAGVQDLGVFGTGQLLLEIPPGQSKVEHIGMCPSECSRQLIVKPLKVISALNHMHYMGRTMKVEVFRNGSKIKDLTNDEHYSYDSPVDHIHDPPFELLAGDEIKTTCVYNSLSTDRYVYYGEGTSEEMCFGFMTYYPKDAVILPNCISYGSMDMCSMYAGAPFNGCDWVAFNNLARNGKIVNDITRNCNFDGFCRPECRKALKELESHPCLTGEAYKWVAFSLQKSLEGLQFLSRLNSCPKVNETICPDRLNDTNVNSGNSCPKVNETICTDRSNYTNISSPSPCPKVNETICPCQSTDMDNDGSSVVVVSFMSVFLNLIYVIFWVIPTSNML